MSNPDDTIQIVDNRVTDFLWIDREIRRDAPNGQTWLAMLQPTCVSIYLCLCSHAGKARESYPSYATIARECGISRQSAIDGIQTLIDSGFLAKGEKTKLRTNIFIILPREKWQVAKSKGRKPRSDKGIANVKRHHKDVDSQSDRLSKNSMIVNKIDSDSQSDRPLIVNQIDSDSQSDRPEVKSGSKVIEVKSEKSSSSSKSSSSIERAKTEEEEGISGLNQSSSLLSPKEIAEIESVFLLGVDEVKGFLIRNKTNFTELSKCLNMIAAKDGNGGTVKYLDFQGRPIQRPLGFIFKNGWITAGVACLPTLHAPEIKKERNRWNNADVVESELEKTKRRLGTA